MNASETFRHWHAEVCRAALPFESRWTMLALRRVDPSLAQRLHEQRGLFDEACITGGIGDIEEQGAAMCRGYAAAARTLAAVEEPDDAYQLGSDPVSGIRVAIGSQRAAVERVRELHGSDVIWITPDEVATMMASIEAFKFIGAVKQQFPGAEVLKRFAECGS